MTNLHDRTGRLREAVVPGRLAEAMPDWLTEAVRPKPAPVPWGAMEGTRPPPLAADTLDRLADAIAAGGRDEDGGNGGGRDGEWSAPR